MKYKSAKKERTNELKFHGRRRTNNILRPITHFIKIIPKKWFFAVHPMRYIISAVPVLRTDMVLKLSIRCGTYELTLFH